MKIAAFVLWLIPVFFSLNSIGQVGDAYGKAAETARKGARQTKCPERAAYLNKLAEYLQCWCDNGKAGATPRNCGSEPGPAPDCKADMMVNGDGNAVSNEAYRGGGPDPVRDMQTKDLQTHMELNNAQNAAMESYQNSVNSGKKESGAWVDATLAGAQNISDPTTSLAYTGAGMGMALISWISENQEAQRTAMLKKEEEERLARLQEYQTMKGSLKTSTTVFNFISGSTDYHFTNLKIESRHGIVKNILRKDLYDIHVELYKIVNTPDSIWIYEAINFKNLITGDDSCVINKISIALTDIKEVQLYNGDYRNAYDPKRSVSQVFRHKNMTNTDLKNAFKMAPMDNEGNSIGSIHSNLVDIIISTSGNFVRIRKKYLAAEPSSLGDLDFAGIMGFSANSYNLVFEAGNSNEYKLQKFVDYLNFINN
ncbi:MAG: hypothetical protein NTW16_17720 [Bacteroidetes bacterium]|nr:hypothetical protein [Bacteroidota bacterium]